ncbi:MAG: FkbM family methyltransferase [Planctomycetota bacterium]
MAEGTNGEPRWPNFPAKPYPEELKLNKSPNWIHAMSLINLWRNIYRHPLSGRAKWHAAKRLISWQISSRFSPGKILVDWIGDSKFICKNGEAGLTGNIYNGLGDFEDMAFLAHFLRPEDCFFDIGANSGAYTLLASKVLGARTCSFEPVPSTFDRLRMNCIINQLGTLVRLENCALGANEGEVDFTVEKDCMNHALTHSTSSSVKVKVRKADDFVQEAPSLLKIDVEGFEYSVLQGAAKVLQTRRLEAIIIELNGSGARFNILDSEVAAILKSHGFSPAKYDPWTRKLEKPPEALSDRGNRLFVRAFESAADRCRNAAPIEVLGLKI